MKIHCRCGFESPVEVSSGSYNVADRVKETGMNFVATSDGELIWLCRKCYDQVVIFAEAASKIVGCRNWSPGSLWARYQEASK